MQPDTPVYPVRVRGDLDPALSRWQWIIKWILAIPHYIVLFFLYIAYFVVTVIAFFAILFTGRYPRGLFDFNVGVMRWGWRVRFYAFAPLGTDRYPPFSLRPDENYPADLDVEYPEQLHRWLVLIKWWLLAIPQYLIVAVIAGGGMRYWGGGGGYRGHHGHGHHGHHMATHMGGMSWVSLIGVLVIIAAIGLLFTGRYPRGLFDFVMGLLRWTIRVRVYSSLMRDEYPPFRLDQGAREPGDAGAVVAAPEPGPAPEPGAAADAGAEAETRVSPEPGTENT
ncbi:DUF4389 domain-containing protein [Nocardia macrotermitis]|uniref:DUF4389 domain-containing protein n=1 Tax=Nocardia macrotermitis TaxID=2585198 RepID=A0A7K0D5Y9_9NOCA|nr:DUF4389 domain-containing protein [Nocardia macrotermitis]MQY20254.1 hypothetical protein [Nocardia macrotermitis]